MRKHRQDGANEISWNQQGPMCAREEEEIQHVERDENAAASQNAEEFSNQTSFHQPSEISRNIWRFR